MFHVQVFSSVGMVVLLMTEWDRPLLQLIIGLCVYKWNECYLYCVEAYPLMCLRECVRYGCVQIYIEWSVNNTSIISASIQVIRNWYDSHSNNWNKSTLGPSSTAHLRWMQVVVRNLISQHSGTYNLHCSDWWSGFYLTTNLGQSSVCIVCSSPWSYNLQIIVTVKRQCRRYKTRFFKN